MIKFKPVLVPIAALVFFVNSALGQNIRYSELQEKMAFDNTPVRAVNGVIASYAPALEDATPAVVTVFRKARPVSQEESQNLDPREELLRRMLGLGNPGGGGQEGLGSGVILTSDGYILTNNHVIDGADRITVALKDSRKEYDAVVIGKDKDTDVAVIKIQASNLVPIKVGDSSLVKVGDVVLAVGNPLGLEQTVTQGIVSALGRRNTGITGRDGYENFIQTDASVNVGNSGGALIDSQGRLIGMNTAIKTDGFSRGNVGIAFAIPSNMAMNIVRKLLDGGGKVRRGFLGINLKDLTEAEAVGLGRESLKGALVTKVNPGTPAAIANLETNDLIVEMDGRPIDDSAQLRLGVSSKDPGEKAEFRVIRNGKERNVSVVLGDLDELLAKIEPQQPQQPRFEFNRNNNRRRMEELEKLLPGRRFNPYPDNGNEAAREVDESAAFLEGVKIKEIDRNLRSALNVDTTVQGVFVESVAQGSEAEKNGLEPGQIITQLDQQNVRSVDDAVRIVDDLDGEILLIQVYKSGRRTILAIPVK